MRIIKCLFILIIIFQNNHSKAQLITTIAGTQIPGFNGDGGAALNTNLNVPRGIIIDSLGNIFFCDYNNHRIRKISNSGIVSTIVGTGVAGYSGDGGAAIAAEIFAPYDLAFDASGNLFFTDLANKRIRKVNQAGIISTIAGNGNIGYSGDGGPATLAELDAPQGIKIDPIGNIYFIDEGNFILRKVDTLGIISTVAGNGNQGFSGDGGNATNASLNFPKSLAIDAFGNIFISDWGNNRIRKIDTAGIITTFAGTGLTFCQIGGLAQYGDIDSPIGLTFDQIGNLFLTTSSNIYQIDTTGLLQNIAGVCPILGYSGDGGPGNIANLNLPASIASDHYGNVYFTDAGNNVIRKISKCLSAIPQICMVQVDSLSENNIIYWDKNLYHNADTFYIYRDTSNYAFGLIGKVPASALSMFIDTVRHLYAANGDPNVTSWRYKIAYHDSCAKAMSPQSPWHQTIYQYNIGGQFIWNHYQIEGQPVPVPGLSSYVLKRDNAGGTGNWVTAASASAASTNINDPQFSTYENLADWKIETEWTTTCTPTQKLVNASSTQTTINATTSNIKKGATTRVLNRENTNSNVTIYPNPNVGIFTVELKKLNPLNIKLYNVFGDVIYKTEINNLITTLDLSIQAKGIYFAHITDPQNNIVKKLVIQ
jgi:hypothetical protein